MLLLTSERFETYPHKMGITPPNMSQSSNSLLSPIKARVDRDKQWYPRTNNDGPLQFWDYHSPKMGLHGSQCPFCWSPWPLPWVSVGLHSPSQMSAAPSTGLHVPFTDLHGPICGLDGSLGPLTWVSMAHSVGFCGPFHRFLWAGFWLVDAPTTSMRSLALKVLIYMKSWPPPHLSKKNVTRIDVLADSKRASNS